MLGPLFVAALLVPAAQADEGEISITVAPIGVTVTDPLEPFDTGTSAALRVGYGLAHGAGIELEVPAAFGKTHYQQKPYMLVGPRLQFYGEALPDEVVSPIFTAGAGAYYKHASDPEGQPTGFVQNDIDLLVSFGTGLLWHLNDTFSLRGDAKAVVNFGTERFPNHGDTFLNWEPNLGVMATFGGKDTDGDGVNDGSDLCVDRAEDMDGFEDDDGCPDADNDGDGVLDTSDSCPLEAEDKDEWKDEDGCPELDNDEDGVPDDKDRCPVDAGTAAADGCPDRDGDQVIDGLDACPDLPGLPKNNGCPDTDDDGVLDAIDECIQEKGDETSFGCPDGDADKIPDYRDKCPADAADPRSDVRASPGCPGDVILTTGLVLFEKPIAFQANGDAIAKESDAILNDIAKMFADVPGLKVEVAVHGAQIKGDETGEKAMQLSNLRALALKDALIGKGVAADRMTAKGYGVSKPMPDGTIAERIELVVMGDPAAKPEAPAPTEPAPAPAPTEPAPQ